MKYQENIIKDMQEPIKEIKVDNLALELDIIMEDDNENDSEEIEI